MIAILAVLVSSCGKGRECFESYEYHWNGWSYQEEIKIKCGED